MQATQGGVQQQSTSTQPDLMEQVLHETSSANSAALLQMRMEHESIMAECRTRRRSMVEMLADLEEQAKACPEFARAAIYNKPAGTVFHVTCNCGKVYKVAGKWNRANRQHEPQRTECEKCGQWAPKSVQKKVEKIRGLSIRSAETLAEVYGFNRTASNIGMLDDAHVKITATFFDYQNLRSFAMERIVSKFYQDWNKQRATYADDKFYTQVVGSEQSKCIREVILRSVKPALKLRLFAVCEQVAADSLDDAEIDKIVAFFGGKGIEQTTLERYIGRSRREGWKKQDRLELLEMWNGVESGETTIDDLFAEYKSDEPSAAATKRQHHGATMEDLAGAPKSATDTDAAAGTKTDSPDAGAAPTDSDVKEDQYTDLIAGADDIGTVNTLEPQIDSDAGLESDAKVRLKAKCSSRREEIHAANGELSNGGTSADPEQEAEAAAYWDGQLSKASTKLAFDNIKSQAMRDGRFSEDGRKRLAALKYAGKSNGNGGQKTFA